MSANGETSTVLRGVTHGAVDFLIKPVRIEELRNVWQHVVRRRRTGSVSVVATKPTSDSCIEHFWALAEMCTASARLQAAPCGRQRRRQGTALAQLLEQEPCRCERFRGMCCRHAECMHETSAVCAPDSDPCVLKEPAYDERELPSQVSDTLCVLRTPCPYVTTGRWKLLSCLQAAGATDAEEEDEEGSAQRRADKKRKDISTEKVSHEIAFSQHDSPAQFAYRQCFGFLR